MASTVMKIFVSSTTIVVEAVALLLERQHLWKVLGLFSTALAVIYYYFLVTV
jgi:hypothetical protein